MGSDRRFETLQQAMPKESPGTPGTPDWHRGYCDASRGLPMKELSDYTRGYIDGIDMEHALAEDPDRHSVE